MNGRVYDPEIAMFLSPDPFVQSPGNTQNYNRYSYCLNNPLMYIDPSGYIFGKLWRWIKGKFSNENEDDVHKQDGAGNAPKENLVEGEDYYYIDGSYNGVPYRVKVFKKSRNGYTAYIYYNPPESWNTTICSRIKSNEENIAANGGGNLPSWPENSAASLGTLAGMI